MSDFIAVTITTATEAEAGRIADALIQEKLAACVTILPGARSLYRWEGEICNESEVVMMVKTRMQKFEGLKQLVRTLNSYSCPCIVATPITTGYQPYLDWLKTETTP
jgi:periplasmic divalent cation tolerance protein